MTKVKSMNKPGCTPWKSILMLARPSSLIAGLTLALSILVVSTAQSFAEQDLSIGRMRVSIWPEHDDPGVLVIYDGRFEDEAKFPTTTSFFIPKDVVISDVCSLSPEGQHFCQLYHVSEGKGDEMDRAIMSLPFSNFYISFHTRELDLKSAKRNIEYNIRFNHRVKSLEVDIQKPLRSSEFNIVPGGGEPTELRGFEHLRYELKDINKGDEKQFTISYAKSDPKPSVDIKYASMSGIRIWGSPYDQQRSVKVLVYIVFGSGLAIAVAALSWIVVRKRKRRA